ncbi:MAG TPA: hypothetical protein VIS48_11005 [Candidatus Kryptonia bacterium]
MSTENVGEKGSGHDSTRTRATVSRKEALTTILIGAFGLFVGPNLSFLEKSSLHQNTCDVRPCETADIAAVKPPQFKTGEKFSFNSFISRDAETAKFELKAVQSGQKVILRGEPVPINQTITIISKKEYNKENCYVVRQAAKVKNPLYDAGSDSSEKVAELVTNSYVNEKGKVVFTESTLTTKQGTSTSVSVSQLSDLPDYSTLDYFFGTWMLALQKGFEWKCASDGDTANEINVTGVENVQGHECYVARVTNKSSGNTNVITYWVDVAQRIVMQAKLGDLVLRRD